MKLKALNENKQNKLIKKAKNTNKLLIHFQLNKKTKITFV